MPFDLFALYLRLPVFALVAGRLGGMVMFQPAIGGFLVPPQVRALLVIGLAGMVTPFVDLPASAPTTGGGLALALGAEVLLGALIGMIVRGCFLSLEWAGSIVATQSGLAFGEIADPSTGVEQSMLSTFYVQLGTLVFLLLGGHRELLAVALDSFAARPLLSPIGGWEQGVSALMDALSLGGEIAIRVAAPAIATLFLSNAALGFLSRTVPQINIATVGFSIKGLLAFLLIAASLPAAMEAFSEGLELCTEWATAFATGD